MYKMKITFYGSCQLEAVSKIFKEYCDCEIQVIVNWSYMLKEIPLPECIYDSDVFIYQVYNSNDKYKEYSTDTIINKMDKNKVKLISMPFISFRGYWPDAFLDIRNNNTKTNKRPYGMFPQQSSILSNQLPLNDEHYTPEYIEKYIENFFNTIEANESKCDIKVCNFIKENYKKKILFYSIQHPCNDVLLHVYHQIVDILKLHETFSFPKEMLYDHTVLILPCVQKVLGIHQTQYKLFGSGVVSQEEYVDLYNKYICDPEL